MKKLSLFLLIALSSALLVTGCGKDKKSEIIEETIATETPMDMTDGILTPEQTVSDVPPEDGMFRSPLTISG